MERLPRVGSMQEIVLNYLNDYGITSSAAIAEKTALDPIQVKGARARLHRYHYITTTHEQWKESISIGKGTIWPEVEKYAQMRMTPREIIFALEFEGKQTPSRKKVENSLNKAWKRGLLPKRTPEEKRLTRTESITVSDEEAKKRVPIWLETAEYLESHHLELPTFRPGWYKAIEEQKAMLEEEESQRQRQLLAEIFKDESLIPNNSLHRRYLIDVLKARQEWVENKNRSLIDNFPTFYEEIDPQIVQTLSGPLAIIREISHFPNQVDSRRLQSALVIESEPDKR